MQRPFSSKHSYSISVLFDLSSVVFDLCSYFGATCFITTLIEANITFQWKHFPRTQASLALRLIPAAVTIYIKTSFLFTVLKLFPTYWKSPARRSRASWRGQSPRQIVPGSSPCESCQRMKRRMMSGGNYAPIGTQRSWSHSWVAENAGQGRGGEKRQWRRRRRETIPMTALGLFQKIS